MPQAVTHFLFPAFLTALFRDRYLKNKDKKHFPLHYVLIAGIGGVLPDFDIIIFWFMQFFGFVVEQVHRTYTHSLLFILILLFLGIISHGLKIKELGKHKMNLSIIFFLLAFGVFTHILLDSILSGQTRPLYPFSSLSIGLNLVQYLPVTFQGLASGTLDGILLMLWIIYIELKHKISDFI